MSKKTKILTVILLAVCLMFQFVMASGAATKGQYNVTLSNWQGKEVLLSGTNGSDYTEYAKISFTGGTANYIYVQVQLPSGSAVSSGWTKLSRSTDYYAISYTSTIGAGTAMQMVGYQKNIEAKTASGYIYL